MALTTSSPKPRRLVFFGCNVSPCGSRIWYVSSVAGFITLGETVVKAEIMSDLPRLRIQLIPIT